MRSSKYIFFAICLMLSSCSEDVEKYDRLVFVVSSKLHWFKPSDNTITNFVDLGKQPYLLARRDNEFFVQSSPYGKIPLSIYVVDRDNATIRRSKEYETPLGEASALAISEKLYTYDFDSPNGAFIAIIDPENLQPVDTVFTNTPYYAQDLLSIGDQLFLCLGPAIKVLNATTFDEIKTIDLSSPVFSSEYSKMILDKDKNILIYNGGVRKLFSNDLTVKALRKQDGNIFGPIKRPAYNADENVLYIFVEKIESGNRTYTVRKFNLNSLEEEDFITDQNILSFEIHCISYHAEAKLIMLGGKRYGVPDGVVKTFDTNGSLQKEYDVENTVFEIH